MAIWESPEDEVRRLLDEGNIAAALERVSAHPTDYVPVTRARVCYHAGRYDEALAELDAAQVDADDEHALLRAGCLRCLGRCDEAEAGVELALANWPECARLWFEAGLCADERCDAEKAARCFRKAVHLGLDTAASWFNLGNALLDSWQAFEAGHAYARARQLGLDSFSLSLNEALALECDGRLRLALLSIESALAQRPGDLHARRAQVRLLIKSGYGRRVAALLRPPTDAQNRYLRRYAKQVRKALGRSGGRGCA